MIRPFLLGLCIPVLALSSCSLSWDRSDTENSIQTDSDAAQQSQQAMAEVSSDYPAITATVIRETDVVWDFHKGHETLDEDKRVSAATRFNTYSVAKAVTGLAYARLIENGAITLDTSVADIAPDLPAPLHQIRIRDLLSHTSGIRHYASPGDWISFAGKQCDTPMQALKYFTNDPLMHPPGTNETYSTFAFVLASELLLRVTGGENFANALNRNLGAWAEFELDHPGAQKARPYLKASRLPELPPNTLADDFVASPFVSAECKFGGGGLIMSTAELARVGAALHNGDIIPKSDLKDRLKPWSAVSGAVYGGGIQTREIADETVTVYIVSGGAPGGRSVLLVLIEPQLSIAIAGNVEGPRLEQTAWRIAESWVIAQP